MAGIWTDERRQVLNGAYVTFKTLSSAGELAFGDEGVLAVAMPLSWGGIVSELTMNELTDGTSETKIGLSLFDNDPKILNLIQAFKNVGKIIVVRTDSGGQKATATLGETNVLTAVANYEGTVGNSIAVSIETDGSRHTVKTFVSGRLKDTQSVASIDDLKDNAFVTFSGTGAPETTQLTYLVGGTNGTVNTSTITMDVIENLSLYEYDVLYSITELPDIEQAIRAEREAGHLVQALVPANFEGQDGYDYEGIIQYAPQSFFDEKGLNITEQVRFYIAGVLAGVPVDGSATFHEIPFVKSVEPHSERTVLEDWKKSGVLFVRRRKDGVWVIEEDANSLTTYTTDRGVEYSSNRVIRLLKVIHDWVISTFEGNYIGKSNTDVIRDLFKSEIAGLMAQFEQRDVIFNFDAQRDIVVHANPDSTSISVDLFIQPVGVLSKLYMNIIVKQNS